jgi:hypothetical protein
MANKNFGLEYVSRIMKRCVLFSILLLGLGGGLFALDFSKIDLSAGGGAAMVFYEEGLSVTAPGYKTGYIKNNWMDWGVFGFFDAQYVEVDIGYFHAFSGNFELSDFGYPLDGESNYEDIKVSYLDITLLLKYPIKFNNNKFVVTVMAGFSYWINLLSDYGYASIWDAYEDAKKTDWDQMWIDVGTGLDQYVTEKIYLRVTAGFSVPLETEEWKNRRRNVGNFFDSQIYGAKANYTSFGAKITVSVGYKINGKKPGKEVSAQESAEL